MDRKERRRLAILSAEEIAALYDLPRFSTDDRRLFFTLSPAESQAVDSVHTTAAAIHLLLQIGYFKAKHRFFVFDPATVAADISFVVSQYFPGKDITTLKPLTKPTRLIQQRIILDLFEYHVCGPGEKEALQAKAQRAAMLSTQPAFIIRELIEFMENERIVAPGYSTLQDIVSRAVTHERSRIGCLLSQTLTPDIKQRLDTLLHAEEHVQRITALKREAKDFSYGEMRRLVEYRQLFQPLHDFTKDFLPQAGVSTESGKYYASLVKFYTIYKLQRMEAETAHLYLLCFAYHRFRQINDDLIEAFIHLAHQYEKYASQAAEKAMQQAFTDASGNLEAAGEVLNLFTDQSIADTTPFAAVKEQAFTLLPAEQMPAVSNYLRNIAFDKTAFEWSHYASLSFAFKRNLRHLFCELEFAGRLEKAPLMEAVSFLQNLLRQGKVLRQTKLELFPTEVIPKGLKRYLFVKPEPAKGGDGKAPGEQLLDVDRYEFLVYRFLRNELEAGNIYVKNSIEYRRFEDDLISDERWEDKERILQEIGSPILSAPIEETLANLREELESKFEAVNRRIAEASNEYIKVKGRDQKRRWTLTYPNEEESVNSPFYGRLPSIGIADLLWFVARNTGFLNSFSHVLGRYVKQEPAPRELFASIVGMGTNMGLGKMAEVSGLSLNTLLNTARCFLRQETLHAANDAISNASAALPAFHLYDIRDEIHSSSDGQRFETQIDTINARYSPKYFGLDRGVSACTVVANHVPVNAKVIGAQEHESHYVFDLLYNNTSDIRPERHSTDTHGTNQVNFWILRVYGYQFAPRYRDVHKKMDKLVGFQNPGHYADFLIKPSRKAAEDIIIAEWPNIQRILASLAQKDVTQATIVRKLSSYSRQNQTKKALWELDNICRTIYLLDFIDNVTLRQAVQKALNRGEAYHRFRRSVSYINNGKFRVKTEAEQQIWNECSRLIANSIIYFNTVLLSRVYEQKLSAGNWEAIEILKGISPVAWRHINLIGKFEFTQEAPELDIDVFTARYADPVFWRSSLDEVPEEMMV